MDSAQCPSRVTEVGYETGSVRTGGLKRKHSPYHHPDHQLEEKPCFKKQNIRKKDETGTRCYMPSSELE